MIDQFEQPLSCFSRFMRWIVFGLACLLTSGCCTRPPAADARHAVIWPVAVLRVSDGDTIAISVSGRTRRVRLLGIDAPRLGRVPGSETHGDRAKAQLEEILAGQTVYLEFDPAAREDQYGRLLAYVWLAHDPATPADDELVNVMMVRNGGCRAVGNWCRSLRHGQVIQDAGREKRHRDTEGAEK